MKFGINRIRQMIVDDVSRGKLQSKGAEAVTLGMNFPAGSFRLADYVGLDIASSVLQHLYEAFGEELKPCPLLIAKVKNGHLGMKTRKVFYDY